MQAQSVRRERQLDRSVPPHLVPDLRPGLLNELCDQVLGAYSAAPHGGIEIGMVLFGKRIGQTIRVQDWRPLPCSHLLGPRFILSPADEELIPEVLSTPERDPALAGTEPVGWCCSHTRNELVLLDRECDFHERYFQKPGTLAVILKPRSPLHADGALFGRNGDGQMRAGEPLLTVKLPIPESATPPKVASTSNAAARNRALVNRPEVLASQDEVRIAAPVHLAPVPTAPHDALVTLVRGWQAKRMVVLACLLAILTAFVFALWREYPRPAPTPPTLSVTLKPTSAGLALVWKSNFPEASSAQARIVDAAGTRNLDLTGSFEPSGVLLFPQQAGNVQTVLTVRSGGHTLTRQATYLDPVKSEIVTPPVPVPAPEKPAKPVRPVSRHRRHRRRS
ncbi:MAG TPA: hypothetical protein VHZ07_23910 [Bryobacteraceae bacterium]|jgi:hypothetical protein|nr:hypothetical protein [Bryobacteraceae bacterium]